MLEKFKGEKRKQQLITAVVILLGIGGLLFFSSLFSKKKPQKKEEVAKIEVEDTKKIEEESFREVYGRELEKLKKKLKKLESEKQQLEKRIEKIREERKSKRKEEEKKLFSDIPNPPPAPPPPEKLVPPPPPVAPPSSPQGPFPAAPEPKQQIELKDLIALEVSKKGKQAPEVKISKPKKKRKQIMPAGAFVKAILLSGLDAPTGGKAQASPHPVLLRVIDEAVMPNLWRMNIRDCFVIGSGYGDLSAERAYIRLEILSCVRDDGEVIERKINGYVAGEDGSVGLRGRVVTKQGQLLARALVAGFIQGIGQMTGQAGTTVIVAPQGGLTQTVNPSQAFQVGLAQGTAQAAQKLVEFYMKLVNEMYPVIEINAGRKVDLVFLSSVNFGTEERRDRKK